MIIPTLRYDDAKAAIDFLETAFGFERKAVMETDDGKIGHAELTHGRGMVMVGSRGLGEKQFENGHTSTYVVVGDVDALHERARAAGAEVTRELQDMDYGSREFSTTDTEGNVWTFGTYDPFAN
jgi:uncharacterized glyoxalase superfamily protein PhnB